jgi:hypothetical protein
MKTRLVFFVVMGLGVAGIFAGPLKIARVNLWDHNCLFSTNCIIGIYDTELAFTTNTTSIPSISVGGSLLSRTFQGQPGSREAGCYGYEYRLVVNRLAGAGSVSITTLTLQKFGKVSKFTYNGQRDNRVWVMSSGGVGGVGPSSVDARGSKITFHFDPPLTFASNAAKEMSSLFFGMASPGQPPNAPNAWAICTGYATVPGIIPVPINISVPVRIP